MKKFFSFVIRQSVAIILIVGLVLGFGIFSAIKMPINLLPDINVPMVCVQVIYPGANAQSVEKDVTCELEDGLSSISGITKTASYSYDNLSALVLSFDYGTDTSQKKADINSKLSALNLPDGISTKVYDIDLNAEALAKISVTGNGDEGLADAYSASKELAKRMQAIDGVESVEIKGGPETYYLIQPYGGLERISPLIVQQFSYGALDIPLGNITENGNTVQIRNNSDVKSVQDIENMPVTLPAETVALFNMVQQGLKTKIGELAQQNGVNPNLAINLALSSETYMRQIREGLKENELTKDLTFSDGLIKFILKADFPEGDMVVKVCDVADVNARNDFNSYVYYSDGQLKLIKGTVIEIYKANGANSAAVVKRAKSVYGDYLKDNGEDIKITLLDDQSQFISDSVTNVLTSMLIGGALAVIVIFLFLKDWRTSLIVAVTMPLSVLAALICLNLMGITLNMVSLGGLAVGIGMLVDNSIVVIESVTKHRERGKSAFEAAVDGTCEVGGALIGSTLTTVCVFIPILFSGGLTGEIFTELSWAVIFSLAFSLIVAVTVIPALYTLFGSRRSKIKVADPVPLKESAEIPERVALDGEGQEVAAPEAKPKKSKLAAFKEPKIMNGITSFYGKVLPKVLNKKLITLLVALCVFGASVGMLFITGTEFLPSIDKGQIEINMTYAPGTSLEEIQENVSGFANVIEQGLPDDGLEGIQNIDYVSVSVGKNGLLALTDTGIITVQLTTNRHTDRVVEKVRALAESYRESSDICTGATVKEIDGVVASLMSGSDDMSVTVIGSDGEKLESIANTIKYRLEEEGFKDVKTSAADTSTQYILNFDRAEMQRLGLDYQTTVLTLRIGIASYTACTVNIDDEQYNVNVSFADGTITSKEQLENFVVGADREGNAVRLADILIANDDGSKILVEEKEACIRRENGNRMIAVSAALPGTDTGTAGKKMKKIASDVLAEYDGYSFQESGITGYLNDAFSGLVIALVVSFVLLYGVMAIQFGSWLKPLIVMSSIPFSFTGGFLLMVITGTRLNVVSFIGLIMLMGVVVNNAIVMLEKIKQLEEEGVDKYSAVQEACKVRLRPIFMTTLTTILALIPLAIGIGRGSELMQPLGIAVIGGLLLGTLVTLIIVPTVYCAIHRISEKYPNGKPKRKKDGTQNEKDNQQCNA